MADLIYSYAAVNVKERPMLRFLKCFAKEDKGATSSEYAILVALIAAVVVMAISGLGTTVNTVLYSNINSIMAAVGGS